MRLAALPLTLFCLGTGLVGHPVGLSAQEMAEDDATLRVFQDCQNFSCDFDHFRREIPYVHWMRDRLDADVHVLGTAQRTGGGGREHTFAFIGQGRFAGRTDTLIYVSSNTDTGPEIRDGLVRTVKLGLVPFLAMTPTARHLTIGYEAPATRLSGVPAGDPWNLWVFTTSLRSFLNGESDYRYINGGGSLEADRTAEDLKLRFAVSASYSRNETDVPEQDTTYVSEQRYSGVFGRAVWSLGARWSAGAAAAVSRSTFFNQDLAVEAGPAIEYDLYPYVESTRRQVTFLYQLGVAAFVYDDVTVFGETSEVRPVHVAAAGAEFRQPWGSVDASLRFRQYLHDLSAHNLRLGGGLEIRIVRGLNLDVGGTVERVKDQLYLSGEGLTPEERLIKVRAVETDFYYFLSLGLSYRFGSKVADVVNPRMLGFNW